MKTLSKAITLLFFSVFCGTLQAQLLSNDAKVSLITVGSGAELYSGFGHSAIGINDSATGIDKVYNYGTFDFKTDNFYVKFVRGQLPYQLSVSPIFYTLYGAQIENREVTEQTLNLSKNQRQKLYNFLENNYLPENRGYKYKFFYDNCSTRLRDAFKVACGDSLVYDNKPIENIGQSYRRLMSVTTADKEWSTFGMNIAIGLPADEVCTPQEEMFLPHKLFLHLQKATIGNQKLVVEQKVLYPKQPVITAANWYDSLLSPQAVALLFYLLLALPFTVYNLRKFKSKPQKISFTFEKTLLSLVGLMGWFLVFLWFGTDHGVTTHNLNVLWIIPLHLPAVWFLSKPSAHKHLSVYFWLCIALLVVVAGIIMVSTAITHTLLIPLPVLLYCLSFGSIYYVILQKLKTWI